MKHKFAIAWHFDIATAAAMHFACTFSLSLPFPPHFSLSVVLALCCRGWSNKELPATYTQCCMRVQPFEIFIFSLWNLIKIVREEIFKRSLWKLKIRMSAPGAAHIFAIYCSMRAGEERKKNELCAQWQNELRASENSFSHVHSAHTHTCAYNVVHMIFRGVGGGEGVKRSTGNHWPDTFFVQAIMCAADILFLTFLCAAVVCVNSFFFSLMILSYFILRGNILHTLSSSSGPFACFCFYHLATTSPMCLFTFHESRLRKKCSVSHFRGRWKKKSIQRTKKIHVITQIRHT